MEKKRGNITFIREPHTEHYTCISNKCLQDTRLSMGARGLLVQILSLPRFWTLYKSELENYNRNSRTSISSVIGELEETGYLTITKEADRSLTFMVNEAPEGTVGIFEKHNFPDEDGGARNVQCDESDARNGKTGVQDMQGQCTEHTVDDAWNIHLLINNKNKDKLTATEGSEQSQFSEEELKYLIDKSYGYVFSDDFYTNLKELEKERGIDPIEYVEWLVEEKGRNAENIPNYVYRTSSNINVVNEYERSREAHKEQVRRLIQKRKEAEVICPDCGHKFQDIDFITRRCVCGLSLNEIMTRKGGADE